MTKKNIVLFDNYNNYELFEEEKKSLQECNPEMVITDAMVWDSINEMEHEDWLECKRCLNELFSKKVVAHGKCGTWRGNFDAIKLFDSIDKAISEIIKDCEYVKIEFDCGEIKIQASHHDGTHHFEIRELRFSGEKIYDNWNYGHGIHKNKSEYEILDWLWQKHCRRTTIKAINEFFK
jgi:hypothetical protein